MDDLTRKTSLTPIIVMAGMGVKEFGSWILVLLLCCRVSDSIQQMFQTKKILFSCENITTAEVQSFLLNGMLVIRPQAQVRLLGSGKDFPCLWSLGIMRKT